MPKTLPAKVWRNSSGVAFIFKARSRICDCSAALKSKSCKKWRMAFSSCLGSPHAFFHPRKQLFLHPHKPIPKADKSVEHRTFQGKRGCNPGCGPLGRPSWVQKQISISLPPRRAKTRPSCRWRNVCAQQV